ncbi:MAG: 30S ribosomal protein S16 [Candidatus Woesebacteria bacterium]|nr:MAG: 30S ribosomal protein S16 [Candidatus Woesebacteria bacterium]
MIAIRLSRFGRIKAPFYRVVAVDSRKKATGMVLKVLGTWNPAKKEFKIDKDELKVWVEKGAQISATVKKLISAK